MAATDQSHTYKKCIVFDFDCTLTSFHTVKQLPKTDRALYDSINDISDQLDPEEIDRVIFKNRIQMLKNHFELLRKNDVDIYIASRGICRMIRRVLESVGLLEYIHRREVVGSITGKISLPVINARNPVGEGCYGQTYQPKDEMIRSLFYDYNYDIIVYADDDHQEHKIFFENPTELDALQNLSDYGARNKYAGQREEVQPLVEKEIWKQTMPQGKYIFISSLPYEGPGLSQEHLGTILKALEIEPEAQAGGMYYYKYMKYKSKYESLKSAFK